MEKPTRRHLLLGATAGAASWFGRSAFGSLPARAVPRSLVGQETPPLGPATEDGFRPILPPPGRTFPRPSYEDPGPWASFAGYRFSFRIHGTRGVYHLDPETATFEADAFQNWLLTAKSFVEVGGDTKVEGAFLGVFRTIRDSIVEWWARADLPEEARAIVALVEGLPKCEVAPFGYDFFDPGLDEHLFEYPPSDARLGKPIPLTSLLLRPSPDTLLAIWNGDVVTRPKRVLLRPCPGGIRLECVNEELGARREKTSKTISWRIYRGATREEVMGEFLDYLERIHRVQPMGSRPDVPPWALRVGLAVHLHGMHPTGRVFLDYGKMRDTLRWLSERFPPDRTLVVLAGWGGAHGRTTPYESPAARMGGTKGFEALVGEARRLGFHLAPTFSIYGFDRRDPAFESLAPAAAKGWDGEPLAPLGSDRNGDLAPDGDLVYLNPGHPTWRDLLLARIGRVLDESELDAVFLDGADAWGNDPGHEVFPGVRDLVRGLQKDRPDLLVAGSGWYDVYLPVFPFVTAPPPALFADFFLRFHRSFSPLSHPAPGRGSTGVHEAGFGRFDSKTLGLREGVLPTVAIVEDTLREHGAVVEAILSEAKRRLGL